MLVNDGAGFELGVWFQSWGSSLPGHSLALWDGVIYRSGMGGPREPPQGGQEEAQVRRNGVLTALRRGPEATLF